MLRTLAVLTATTEMPATLMHESLTLMSDGVTLMSDSVSGAMTKLQSQFARKKTVVDAYFVESKGFEAKENNVRLKLQAFWQLLVTGFEVRRKL